MKMLVVLFYLFLSSAYANTVSGSVEFIGAAPKGVLYIFARKAASPMPMPLAVKRIQNPRFPVAFSLSSRDAMVQDTPFTGPFTIVARLSPSGDPLDKTGVEVKTDKPIELGASNVKLVLKP